MKKMTPTEFKSLGNFDFLSFQEMTTPFSETKIF